MAKHRQPRPHGDPDPRAEKRYLRKAHGSDLPVYEAHGLGEYHGYSRKTKRNPYPPGRRHDHYERGFELGREQQHWPNTQEHVWAS